MTVSTNETNETDLALALQPLTEQLEVIAATVSPASEKIGATLEALWQSGADEKALMVISNNAEQLVNVITTMNTAATVAQNVARKAITQRDQITGALRQHIADVKNMNTDNELVQGLVDMVCESEQEYWWEMADESRVEDLMNSTPFEEIDCNILVSILFGENLDGESHFWDELYDWMHRVRDSLKGKNHYFDVVKFSDEQDSDETEE